MFDFSKEKKQACRVITLTHQQPKNEIDGNKNVISVTQL